METCRIMGSNEKIDQSLYEDFAKNVRYPRNWRLSKNVRPLHNPCFNLSSLIYSCRRNIKYVLLNTRGGKAKKKAAEKGN